ncbi:MAG: HNH endonuclease [Desulfobacteraceae bacterium]|nr:MAG: HNH endonuclease [Desulfobacteraceae bacterium]
MSVSNIPEPVKLLLWGKAAGRCQYEGCGKPLWRDDLTKAEFNAAYIAHIIADKPTGPRGDAVLSERLGSDLSNLMLLCDEHHRLIDKVDVAGHPVDRLRAMKVKQETRMELLTGLPENRKSHVLLYGANIGEQSARVSWAKAAHAMTPEWYPAEPRAIELSIGNSAVEDHDNDFWGLERRNLRLQFQRGVKPRLSGAGDIGHLSIFAFAPIPLLVELGRLLSDIPAAEVYQLHREPPDWRWQETPNGFAFSIEQPEERKATVALNLSLSATIDNSRIMAVLPQENLSIWRMTVPEPSNDFMKGKDQLRLFRQQFRLLLDRIKGHHGQDVVLHVFPAVPVSVAVEIGRVWMPKADLPLCIYDQNRKLNGFTKALEFPEDRRSERC